MKITLTACGATLEGNVRPGTTIKCPQCNALCLVTGPSKPNKPFSLKPKFTKEPYKDDCLVPILFSIMLAVVVALSAFMDEQVAMLAASLFAGAMGIWMLSLLRVCAHRLYHLEQLLAEQAAAKE